MKYHFDHVELWEWGKSWNRKIQSLGLRQGGDRPGTGVRPRGHFHAPETQHVLVGRLRIDKYQLQRHCSGVAVRSRNHDLNCIATFGVDFPV